MYDQAKKEKLKQIKRLMFELMAEEGDEEMSSEDLEAKLDEASDAASGEEAEMEVTGESPEGDEMAEGEMEVEEEEPNYFQPKDLRKRPGTAIVIAKPPEYKPSLREAIPQMKKKARV